jgi:hypothetical protein
MGSRRDVCTDGSPVFVLNSSLRRRLRRSSIQPMEGLLHHYGCTDGWLDGLHPISCFVHRALQYSP